MPRLSGTRFDRASGGLDVIQIVVSGAALLAAGFLSSGAAFLGAAFAGAMLVGAALVGPAAAGTAGAGQAFSTPVPAGPALSSASDDRATPVAGAFVYPVGDELDFKKADSGSAYGWYVSDPYLAVRGSKKQRTHFGVDLSCGRGGDAVRAIGSGVVVVADANALMKVTTKRRVKVAVTAKGGGKGEKGGTGGSAAKGKAGAGKGKTGAEKGKTTYKTVTKTRTTWKWRTGWGNYVVLRHVLPSGETYYSLYAHLAPKSVTVKAGDEVAAGKPIGKVGKSGRASSPHLHLEVRRSAAGAGENADEEEESTPETRMFARLDAVDPLAFLDDRVRRYEDLEPGSWESRYALAACRDGLAFAEGDEFEPGDAVTRGDYYASLVSAFGLTTAFPSRDWSSTVAALVDAGVVSAEAARVERERETLARSEALEILLRCLDGHRARAHNLASLDAMSVSRDFNRQFAGSEAADRAEREAKATAEEETRARRKAEADRVAKARKQAKAAGKKASRVKEKPVRPVKPVPVLDPGFESLAQSEKKLTRAEVCLLLATAMRPEKERYSALQRAAIRVAQSE